MAGYYISDMDGSRLEEDEAIELAMESFKSEEFRRQFWEDCWYFRGMDVPSFADIMDYLFFDNWTFHAEDEEPEEEYGDDSDIKSWFYAQAVYEPARSNFTLW